MLKLTRADLDRICAQAAAEYPAECCGVLTVAAGDAVSRVHPCRNIQQRLHAEDPERYPRPARAAYFIDGSELYRIVSVAEKEGGGVSGFYHSHIDCAAYFSEEDKRRAMTMMGDEPDYPGAVYLVLSVYEGRVRGYRCFAWRESGRDFVEVDLEVLE